MSGRLLTLGNIWAGDRGQELMEFKASADKITKEWVLIQKHPEDQAPSALQCYGSVGTDSAQKGAERKPALGVGRGVVW